MANITNLSWKVTKNKNWISVSPTAGTGNQSVTVQVTQAECVGEADLTGVITFTCNECPEGQKTRTINVTRCAPTDCGEPVTSTSYGKVAGEAAKCDTSKTVSVPFTSTTSYTVCGCASESSTDSKSVTVNFEKNETYDQKIHYFDVEGHTATSSNYNIKITQAAGPCTCNCNELTVSPTSFTWEWNETGSTNQKVATITCPNCLSITSVTTSTTNFNVSWNSSTKKITIVPKEENTSTTSNKTGTITIKYKRADGTATCDSKSISLTQKKRIDPCSTKTITITPTNASGQCSGGSVTFTATTTINS